MKTSRKAARDRAPKRDLFGELSEGMNALAEVRHGERALRAHTTVELSPPRPALKTRRRTIRK
jgi:hypothetical protein